MSDFIQRNIGDIFYDNGIKLKVCESTSKIRFCDTCYFDGNCDGYNIENLGWCCSYDRVDNKNIVFIKCD